MCIALPMEIKSINTCEKTALCESMGVRQIIAIDMCKNLKAGDFVLVHAGYAIEILDKEEAENTLEIFRELGEVGKP